MCDGGIILLIESLVQFDIAVIRITEISIDLQILPIRLNKTKQNTKTETWQLYWNCGRNIRFVTRTFTFGLFGQTKTKKIMLWRSGNSGTTVPIYWLTFFFWIIMTIIIHIVFATHNNSTIYFLVWFCGIFFYIIFLFF